MEFNNLPEGFEGEQKRETEFDSPEAKLAYDAQGLIKKATLQSERVEKPVDPISFAQRTDDDVEALRAVIAKEQGAVKAVTANETLVPAAESPIIKAPRQLTPEQKEFTLATLAARFKANENLHKGVEWTKVKASLEAKPEALWSINEMEKAGHQPDVYNADDNGFDIGTCSKESPESGRNCVFDESAEEWMKTNRPNKRFNGNAVAMAKAMGIDLMDPNLYKNVLQKKGRFDEQTWSWLLTQLAIRSTGDAFGGDRHGADVCVYQDSAADPDDSGSWRGSLRVEWAA